LIDIAPFERAVKAARGEIIVTSCGFLSYWQSHLSNLTKVPFISSSLNALDQLSRRYEPHEVLTLTLDAESLAEPHYGDHRAFAKGVAGLPKGSHLRAVIAKDETELDTDRVEEELVDLVTRAITVHHKHLLLECTNLPPYKAALRRVTGLPVSDILTCIEARRPGTIHPQFLQ
jgi:phosphoribosyl-ATP pyrophosphohydrolase